MILLTNQIVKSIIKRAEKGKCFKREKIVVWVRFGDEK